MDELKSVRSGDHESGRMMGFKKSTLIFKGRFSIIWTKDRIISTEDRTFPKVTKGLVWRVDKRVETFFH